MCVCVCVTENRKGSTLASSAQAAADADSAHAWAVKPVMQPRLRSRVGAADDGHRVATPATTAALRGLKRRQRCSLVPVQVVLAVAYAAAASSCCALPSAANGDEVPAVCAAQVVWYEDLLSTHSVAWRVEPGAAAHCAPCSRDCLG